MIIQGISMTHRNIVQLHIPVSNMGDAFARSELQLAVVGQRDIARSCAPGTIYRGRIRLVQTRMYRICASSHPVLVRMKSEFGLMQQGVTNGACSLV